jgi:hypothetical protein
MSEGKGLSQSFGDATDGPDVLPFFCLFHAFRGEDTSGSLLGEKVESELPGDSLVGQLLI